MTKKISTGGGHSIVMICSYCKTTLNRVSDLENDATAGIKNQISHGICPDCLLEHFPAEYLKIQEEYRLRIKFSYRKATAQHG